MAAKVVDRGLQVIGGRASNTADGFSPVQAMSVDDRSVAFADGDTSLGNPATEADAAFDSTPTRSGQSVSHVATYDTSVVLLIRRVALHNAAPASVTPTSNTLVAGVDGQSLQKTPDFALTLTLRLVYSRPA